VKTLNTRLISLITIILVFVFGQISVAVGQDEFEEQQENSNDWEFIVLPYLWMTGINGDVTVKGTSSDVDVDFSDILKHLDLGGEVHIEIRRGRYGLFIDPTFLKLSSDKNVPLGNGVEADEVTVKEWLVEFGGFYRFGPWKLGSPYNEFVQRAKPFFTFDALAGGRYINIDVEIDLKGTPPDSPSEVDGDKNWLDLFVGGRFNFNITNKIPLIIRSDFGGFGFGFSSDFAWNLVSHIGYELPWYRITPVLGYRVLYIDYADGSGNGRFVYNTWTHGPIIGVAFRF
jgi:hypothetical protein